MTYTEKQFCNIQTRKLYEIHINADDKDGYVAAAIDGADLRELLSHYGIDTDKCHLIKVITEDMPVRFIDYRDVSVQNMAAEIFRRGWTGTLSSPNGEVIEISKNDK